MSKLCSELWGLTFSYLDKDMLFKMANDTKFFQKIFDHNILMIYNLVQGELKELIFWKIQI